MGDIPIAKGKSFYLLLILLSSLSFISLVSGLTYYISPAGNDATGDGSEGSPWRTLRETIGSGGSNLIANGDTVVMENGYYYENATALSQIYTALNSITIRARNPGQAILECGNCSTFNLFLGGTGGTGITIDGLFINNTRTNTGCLQVRGSNGKAFIYNMTTKGCKDSIAFTPSGGTISQGIIKYSNLWGNKNAYLIHLHTGTANVNITDNNFTGDINFNMSSSSVPIFTNNSIYGTLEVLNEATNWLANITPGNISSISFDGVHLTNPYTISGLTFIHENITASLNIIYLINSSNFIIEDNSFGNSTNWLWEHDSTAPLNVISLNTWVSNITIRNNSFYLNYTYSAVNGLSVYQTGMIDNVVIDNNTVYVYNSTFGLELGACVKNSVISNNSAYAYTHDLNHLIGFGKETNSPGEQCWNMMINNTLAKNKLYGQDNIDTDQVHMLFMGFNTNFSIYDNYVYGGRYNYVIKSNNNGLVRNNTAVNGTFFGILHKGGSNVTYENTIIYPTKTYSTSIPLSIADNAENLENVTVDNVTFTNMTIYSGVTTAEVQLRHNASVKFYDVTFNDSKLANDSNPLFNLTSYYSLIVGGDDNAHFNLTDGQGNFYGDYNTHNYTDGYYISRFYDPAGTLNYSNYSYSASLNGSALAGSFNLTEPYNLTLTFLFDPEVSVTALSDEGGTLKLDDITEDINTNNSVTKEFRLKRYIEYTYKGEKHTLKLEDIDNDKNSVKISIRSETKYYTLYEGKTKFIDVDIDGYYDLKINLTELKASSAVLMMSLIVPPKQIEIQPIDAEEIPAEGLVEGEVTNEEVIENKEENIRKTVNIRLEQIIPLILIGAFVIFIFFRIKKRNKA